MTPWQIQAPERKQAAEQKQASAQKEAPCFRPRSNVLSVLVGVQALCWLVFLFGDIGFDKAGKFGLDYDAFILIAVVYGIAFIAGITLGLVQKRKLVAPAQVMPILLYLAYMVLPDARFDPARYQDLVGKSRAEVEKRIGHPRGMTTGAISTDEHRDMETISLKGMTIYLSRSGVVQSVEANNQ